MRRVEQLVELPVQTEVFRVQQQDGKAEAEAAPAPAPGPPACQSQAEPRTSDSESDKKIKNIKKVTPPGASSWCVVHRV